MGENEPISLNTTPLILSVNGISVEQVTQTRLLGVKLGN